jgi:hypothetical protein
MFYIWILIFWSLTPCRLLVLEISELDAVWLVYLSKVRRKLLSVFIVAQRTPEHGGNSILRNVCNRSNSRCDHLFALPHQGYCLREISFMNVTLLEPIWLPKSNFLHSHTTTKKMRLLSQIIYSCKTLYMFRAVFPFIIRSSKLRIQQRYMSSNCCYLLLSGMRWNFLTLIPLMWRIGRAPNT